jgi:hypothetical protein
VLDLQSLAQARAMIAFPSAAINPTQLRESFEYDRSQFQEWIAHHVRKTTQPFSASVEQIFSQMIWIDVGDR